MAKKKSGTRKRSPKKVRIAMIGAGSMSTAVHYPSLAAFDDVEIAAICDVDTQRLNEAADKYGVDKRYTDYKQMIEQASPDGVYAIGQPHYMYDIWVWCLQQSQNLYIEKPMGLTLHQAQILAHLAETQGVITQVSHQRRTCPLLVKMRQACLKKGPITHATCEFFKCQIAPGTFATDHMMDDCTHSIDTVRWMCGGEVVGIDSHCKRIGVPDINWIGAMLHFDNGATGLVINSWSSGRRVFRVQMHGPGIYCDAEVEGKAYLYADGDYEGKEYETRQVAGSDDIRIFAGFEAKNRQFIDAIKTGKPVTGSPFSDCVKTVEVAETILAQAILRNQ